MISLLLSVLAYFLASFWLRRYFDRQELPPGRVRSLLIFTLALAVSYGVGALAGRWLS
ncbi:hypothetical protein [Azospira inquinata]|uniref:Uncharacterized protein n=1 Tax=Azospira inquinata TaxID=2785627 RepID=A0A975XUA5_9RHOO|nr:hypothetical protein [Azospira inquinata]QWT46116.1 hypothetical protein J8L76_14670 [Azospira inquinata]QWT48555.1 hypothetical protein Azoinq_11940 [Azospira inquinata]